jgi:DNA-binding response OmpR family regulator
VKASGASASPARTAAGLDALLPDIDLVIVDLTARAYDGVTAIEAAHAAGRPVLAVGQHDDQVLRARARTAGADRVYAYRKLFEDGPATLAAWIAKESPP